MAEEIYDCVGDGGGDRRARRAPAAYSGGALAAGFYRPFRRLGGSERELVRTCGGAGEDTTTEEPQGGCAFEDCGVCAGHNGSGQLALNLGLEDLCIRLAQERGDINICSCGVDK